MTDLLGRIKALAAAQVLELADKLGTSSAYGVSTSRAREVLAEEAAGHESAATNGRVELTTKQPQD